MDMISSSLVCPRGTVCISASQPRPEDMTVGSIGVTISVVMPASSFRKVLSDRNFRWFRRNSFMSAGAVSPLIEQHRSAQKSSRSCCKPRLTDA